MSEINWRFGRTILAVVLLCISSLAVAKTEPGATFPNQTETNGKPAKTETNKLDESVRYAQFGGDLWKRWEEDRIKKYEEEQKRAAEEQRRIVMETERRLQEQRQAEERAEERRQTEERQRVEERRQAEERQRAEERRQAEERQRAEKRRQAEERQRAQERQQVEERRREEGGRQAEERRREDEFRRRAEELQRVDKAHRAVEQFRRTDLARQQAEELRRLDEARQRAERFRYAAEEARRRGDEFRSGDYARRQAEELRHADETRRRVEEFRHEDEANRKAEELRRADFARRQAAELKQADELRGQAEKRRRAEERRQAEELQRVEELRKVEERRRQDEEARQHSKERVYVIQPRVLGDGSSRTSRRPKGDQERKLEQARLEVESLRFSLDLEKKFRAGWEALVKQAKKKEDIKYFAGIAKRSSDYEHALQRRLEQAERVYKEAAEELNYFVPDPEIPLEPLPELRPLFGLVSQEAPETDLRSQAAIMVAKLVGELLSVHFAACERRSKRADELSDCERRTVRAVCERAYSTAQARDECVYYEMRNLERKQQLRSSDSKD